MKKICTTLLLLSLGICNAQSKDSTTKTKLTETKVTSISYIANKIDELETINWEEVKEVFSENKEEQTIELTFGIDLKKSKNKFKSSIKVSGASKNLDSLIYKSKKGVKSLIRISKKYNN